MCLIVFAVRLADYVADYVADWLTDWVAGVRHQSVNMFLFLMLPTAYPG